MTVRQTGHTNRATAQLISGSTSARVATMPRDDRRPGNRLLREAPEHQVAEHRPDAPEDDQPDLAGRGHLTREPDRREDRRHEASEGHGVETLALEATEMHVLIGEPHTDQQVPGGEDDRRLRRDPARPGTSSRPGRRPCRPRAPQRRRAPTRSRTSESRRPLRVSAPRRGARAAHVEQPAVREVASDDEDQRAEGDERRSGRRSARAGEARPRRARRRPAGTRCRRASHPMARAAASQLTARGKGIEEVIGDGYGVTRDRGAGQRRGQ